MNLGLHGKVVLVPASTRGLGRAAAGALAREGAFVVICSRSAEAESVAGEISAESGQRVVGFRADVSQPDDIEMAVERTLSEFGRIDGLVLNTGGPPAGGFLDLSPSDWEKATQLTLMSAVRMCYAAVPHMIQQGAGSIVGIQSYTVKQPLDNLILSNSIRMAVIGMLNSLARELGPKGIRVNSINPSWTRTERVDQLLQERADVKGTTPEVEEREIVGTVPMGRMGSLEEFGKTLAWLISPAASYVNGHALFFDGGTVAAPL